MVIVRKKKEEEKNSKYKYIGYEIKEGMKEFKSPNIPPPSFQEALQWKWKLHDIYIYILAPRVKSGYNLYNR